MFINLNYSVSLIIPGNRRVPMFGLFSLYFPRPDTPEHPLAQLRWIPAQGSKSSLSKNPSNENWLSFVTSSKSLSLDTPHVALWTVFLCSPMTITKFYQTTNVIFFPDIFLNTMQKIASPYQLSRSLFALNILDYLSPRLIRFFQMTV